MKKQILKIATAFIIGSFLMVSCSENTGAETTIEESHADHNHASTYQCPMDCEDGKTYEEAGKCAVCNMDLKENEHQH